MTMSYDEIREERVQMEHEEAGEVQCYICEAWCPEETMVRCEECGQTVCEYCTADDEATMNPNDCYNACIECAEGMGI